jgi:hypothetical protein
MGNENAQMDKATAEAVVLEGIYLPAFVEKCASLGVPFPDEESIRTALQTSFKLKEAAANESTDIVKAAHAAVCAASGEELPAQAAAREAAEKEASEKASKVAAQDVIKQAFASLAQPQAQ